MIIINILNIILGCVVLYLPNITAEFLTIYVGVTLMVYAVFSIAYMFIIKKNAKDVEKLIKEKAKIIDAEPKSRLSRKQKNNLIQ